MFEYDVMLDEANLWLDEPPHRKRKLEAPPPPPPIIDYTLPTTFSDSDEEEIDPVEREKYRKQVVESGGFDVDFFPVYGSLDQSGSTPSTVLLSKLGLHSYNFDKGTNLQFRSVQKANEEFASFTMYYITVEAMDPFNASPLTFQTCVWDAATKSNETSRFITKVCRIKGTSKETSLWDHDAVDEFYKDDISWLQDDALTGSDMLQYYEVKESDMRDNNEWLQLYAELVMFSKWETDLSAYLPVKMKKIVVRTREDVESSKKLRSKNATFYMSFTACGGLQCRGIIRRTTDGRPQHMSFQVNCWIDN
ncbi:unnamed protein product [Eruca vesicaria subsp. sativa]|uniref:Uncharacterized protein n=1 Tax=Eruca vesicaria subsp. sativa TaxID=29727 RepID=A0ABC8LUX3_ERUVS|nr:unnamed protein product [Eruca vesicaria subsp. sativa]